VKKKGRARQPRKKQPGKAKWLIMVYINVDGWKANFAVESLKQLKSGATKNVVVAAQLGVEGSNDHRRYVFDGKTEPTASIEDDNAAWEAPAEINMAQGETLTAFIEWARKRQEADRYCLVLWMDGVLPLYEPLARRKSGEGVTLATRAAKMTEEAKRTRYIRPYELRQALERAHLDDAKGSKARKKLQIVAMDACSMSMVEYAYELKDVAEYLVASEEAVPYWSFPYTAILKHFRRPKEDVHAICQAITKDYTRAYQDCLCLPENGMNPVMLSALRLGNQGIDTLANPLNNLAELMQSGIGNGRSPLSQSILEARRNSQDFALGTFVDLADFCDSLSREEHVSMEIKQACDTVCKVVRERFVKANEVDPRANKNACTGAMIYFPYFKESKQQDNIDVVLDKGLGSSSGEGGLGKSAAGVSIATRGSHYALRQEVIKDIEDYYQAKNFKFDEATNWYKFIRGVWSPILAQNEPWLLDLRYSAEQCATNLVNGSERRT
jgi:hypothetical protein